MFAYLLFSPASILGQKDAISMETDRQPDPSAPHSTGKSLSEAPEYNRWSTSNRKFCGDNSSFFKFFKLFRKKKKIYKSHFMYLFNAVAKIFLKTF